MAFREPMGFAPTAVRRRGSPKKKTAGKPRRRAAVVGGVSRTSPASTKENRSMAKRKKARTPAQKAATKRMLAANKRARSNPTKSTKAKAKPKKKIGVKRSATGRRSVKVKTGTKPGRLTRPAQKLRKTAQARTRTGVRRTYKQYKNKKYGVVIRENPANRGKAIMAAAGGFAVGIVGADILDRYIATRAPEGTDTALSMQGAKEAINAKPDGMRIFAQAAGTGVSAVGAYMLRKKSMVGTYLLGGVAAAFAAKALGMVVKGHLMPALMPAKGSDSDWVKRMAYGDLAGPRGYMGAPRPFQGKPARIGPQATGSVGSYGCTRVPVNASEYMTPEPGRGGCSPWPFQVGSQGSDCIDKVGRTPSGQVPRPAPSPRTPGPGTIPGPRTPRTPDIPRDPRDPGGEEFVPGRRFEVKTPPPMRFMPAPSAPGVMPFPGGTPRPPAPGGSRFSPVSRLRQLTDTNAPAKRQGFLTPKVPQVY